MTTDNRKITMDGGEHHGIAMYVNYVVLKKKKRNKRITKKTNASVGITGTIKSRGVLSYIGIVPSTRIRQEPFIYYFFTVLTTTPVRRFNY